MGKPTDSERSLAYALLKVADFLDADRLERIRLNARPTNWDATALRKEAVRLLGVDGDE
jgi:hypothetical protein